MPLIDILILTGIVSAFAVFGLVLAWGNHQTRHLPPMRTAAEQQAQDTQDNVKLAA